ncbi:Transketolase central region [Methanolacinia petrolearia DSM 11571]|uniref:1-deoxy-D-xylulose-5-phosphate synthase n=1 Tax=Methanolacinia petrolearia (strain DSM 11571 / OCM 486 / SEBR 4847) TaxID=679926 RepID=E1REX6_METP4|nr:transketolase C-terminal domain-containing protein [Methanolacinia petrolearia]ADN36147.1 Transketolase central region [Methanolacinia petrolearia DSM 11571]
MTGEIKVTRDVFLEGIHERMLTDENIFFLCADFGSPKLDAIREDFPDRFINVGIAEQNLINVATGLALEGFTVYAYAIAPFLTMRAYEQIRINLSLHAQLKDINVNLIGVGAGLSYDVSGPTHHCLEDISIIRTLPNIVLFSPSDWLLAQKFIDYSIYVKKPKYLRFDGKPVSQIYNNTESINFENGFSELFEGDKICIISTGIMTQKALNVIKKLAEQDISVGLIDVYILKPFNEELFFNAIKRYSHIITLEEAFINKGGLDSMISNILECRNYCINISRIGFKDEFVFDIGSRDYLHRLNNLDEESINKIVLKLLEEN